jgi:chorismate mutase / prephenate dehydratase
MSDQGSTTDKLDTLVQQLDALDSHLLEILRKRADLAVSVAQTRRSLELPAYTREGEESALCRLEQETTATGSRLTRGAVRAVFREILSACAVLDAPLRVGYLGPPGTFSHMAARSAFGLGASYVEHPNIAQVFASVERGQIDFGVAPIENSTEGGVTFTLDCLLTSDVRIRSEFPLDVSLYLLGKSRDFSKIERVYSHPQPLGQCRAWLAAHLPHAQLVSTSSTTAAAREAVTDEASVAVGSHLAAELYDLEVLASAIQDVSVNVTRFVVLAKTDAPPTGKDKTSVVFSTADERGALLKALTILYSAGLNLSRIESRPLREKLWEYVFFTDLDGHRTDPAVSGALGELARVSRMVKILGSYPRHD